MKKVISLILATIMLMSFVGTVPAMAADVASGTCGTNLTWTLDDAGTLTISGKGAMNWSGSAPWNSYMTEITKVVIGEGVTSISYDAFYNYDYITEVKISSTVTTIEGWAFASCDALAEVTIPPTVENIEHMAFYGVETIYGYTYSAAWILAKDDENITFVSLGELPEEVLSEGECGEGVTYTFTNRNVLTVSGKGEISAYGYEESPWSEYMLRVEKVVINEGVTAIGDGAFNGCININSVAIPEGVTSIGSMAFYGCNYIEELNLPSTLRTIGDNAFDSTGLVTLTIPEGVTSIGNEAFAYSPIKMVTIPESVTFIGDGAFGDGYNTPSIQGVKGSYAETWAQENWAEFLPIYKEPVNGTWGDNLIWVFDPDGTLTITGEGAMQEASSSSTYPWYEYSKSITNIIIGDGVTSVSWYAFQYCSNLISVTLSYKVQSVGYSAFYFAPDSLVVKGYTNSYAENFALTYSYSFESLGDAPRYEVANGNFGTNVTWTADNYGLVTVSGSGDCDSSSYWHSGITVTEMVIGEGITSIGSYLFEGMSKLEKVTLPESLQAIGEYAFTRCSKLTSVTIPMNVTTIKQGAFSSSVTIKGFSPSAAEDFAANNGNVFESLGKAPLAVVALGKCGDTLTWTVDNYRVLTISGTGAMSYSSTESGSDFDAGGAVGGVEVGTAALMSISSYDVPWYDYTTYIKDVKIENGVTTIADYAFYGLTNVTEIIVPESVVSIGEYAFNSCSNLEKVQIHYNTTDIADNIFYYTYNVKVYGYTYSVAEECAAESNREFVSLGEAPILEVVSGNVNDTIVWSLNSIGTLTISGTGEMPHYSYSGPRPWDNYREKIKCVEINGVDRVYEYTISNCDNLTSVKLNRVKCVDSQAFNYCNYITEATISPETERLGRTAFYYNASSMTIKGAKNSYAQIYAEVVGSNFEETGDEILIDTVYASTVDELVNAIKSNRTIVLKDGIYLLDKTAIFGDPTNEYSSWEYADVIKIENVSNLTIKAENPGNVEIISSQITDLSNYSDKNSVFCVQGGYNLTFEGIRFGHMRMLNYSYNETESDEAELMGGYDEYGMGDYYGIYAYNEGYGDYVTLTNKINVVNCDIFNCTHAIYLYGGSVLVEDSVIRDNVKGAVLSYSGDISISDSILSRNGNNSAYKNTYCLYMNGSVSSCIFINNGNERFCSSNIAQEDNIFENNTWDGEPVKAYGVTQNGITWQVVGSENECVLNLGYDITVGDNVIESATGEIYPYSVNSIPWKEYDVTSFTAADGVVYNELIWGGCGKDALWKFTPQTSTLQIYGVGEMSDIDAKYMWEKYSSDIESIVIADTVTGVYNNFYYTPYYINEANWENGILYIGDVLVKAKTDITGEVKVKEGTRVIADEAFYNCQSITSVVLPESVEHIGVTEKLGRGYMGDDGVFEYCYALEGLTIPASVTAFDHAMVYSCNSLKDIYYSGTMAQWKAIDKAKRNDQLGYCVIHASDGTIEPDPFYYEVSEDGVTITGIYPFATEIVIPKEIEGLPVIELAVDLFVEHTSIVSVTIEADVEVLPYFTNAANLESVVLGDGIKYIFDGAFEGCEKLAKITLGDNIEEMSASAFEDTAYAADKSNYDGYILYVDGYATALSPDAKGKITVRSDARGVCYDTFNNNSAVTEVVIPDGVKMQNFGEGFYNMSALVSITLPDTFVAPDYGFGVYDCEKLVQIVISENHQSLVSVEGVVFTKDMATLVYMPMGRSESYTIPETVTTIGEYAFMDTHLPELTIPATVNYISNSAFPFSYYLSDIYYNITAEEWKNTENLYIGYENNAFDRANLHLLDCDFEEELVEYMLSDDGTYYIVTGCKNYATEIDILAEYEGLPVKMVKSYAFMNKPRLAEINVDAKSAYYISVDGVLFARDMTTLVAYPAGRVDESYTIPEGVTAIGENAFAYSKNLTSIDLGDELTSIGSGAFKLSGITSVSVPETVTELMYGVFDTQSLEKVYLGTNINSIEYGTFAEELKYIYFDGTINQWYNVTGNWYISYETTVITKVEIVEANAQLEEEEIVVNFYIDGADYNQKVFAIGLDSDGVQITYDEVSGEYVYAGYLVIEEDSDKLKEVEQIKLFVWDGIETMRPLGDPVIIEVWK